MGVTKIIERVKLYKSTLLANLDKVVKVVLASGILVMLETSFIASFLFQFDNLREKRGNRNFKIYIIWFLRHYLRQMN